MGIHDHSYCGGCPDSNILDRIVEKKSPCNISNEHRPSSPVIHEDSCKVGQENFRMWEGAFPGLAVYMCGRMICLDLKLREGTGTNKWDPLQLNSYGFQRVINPHKKGNRISMQGVKGAASIPLEEERVGDKCKRVLPTQCRGSACCSMGARVSRCQATEQLVETLPVLS